MAKTSIKGKTVYIGTFDTQREAEIAYGKKRDEVLQDLVDKYEQDLTPSTLEVLRNFTFVGKVE